MKICAQCRYSAVYDENQPHMRGVLYCERPGVEPLKLAEQERRDGQGCGPDGTLYEDAEYARNAYGFESRVTKVTGVPPDGR